MMAPMPKPSRRPAKPRFFDDDGGNEDEDEAGYGDEAGYDEDDLFAGGQSGSAGAADSNCRWNSSAASITISVDGVLT